MTARPSPATPNSDSDANAAEVVAAIARVVRPPAALHEPVIAGNEWAYVKECLDSGWVSSAGAFVDRFESMILETTEAAHAVATVNGTAALHACLLLAGVRAGDEVIVPALTFVATANAVAYCGATPHFADCERSTFGLDPVKLDAHLTEIGKFHESICINRVTGRPLRAVICMHAFGHPNALDEIADVCSRHRMLLIEDAAESLGSFYRSRHTGTIASLGALSFNGNKIVTTGGGGAILTSDPALARRARHLTTTAKAPHRWAYVHDALGFNYRLPNINAALGCAQLERLFDFVARKRRLAAAYRRAFEGVSGVHFVDEPKGCRSNFWLNGILIKGGETVRDSVLAAANDAGFACRPAWEPMHRLKMYSDAPKMDLSTTESVHRQLVNLPSGAGLA